MMKNGKMFLAVAAALVATGVFAGENLPASAADWPDKLLMTHKMLFLVLQIGIILFAAKLGGMLASLLKLPSVLGELAAGIAIGPWALGGIPIPGFDGMFSQGLFYGHALRAQALAGGNPFAVTPELYGICTVASVVLLFLSGLETNLRMFLKYAFAGSLVGIGGVVFSFIFGDLCAVYATSFFPDLLGGIDCLAKLGELVRQGELVKAVLDPAAMFMGIMSTATSVGITARILSERKKMDSEEGVTIMAGAVIDDVLGIIVLAIGMGIIASQQAAGAVARGVDWGAIGKTAASAFGVWLGGTLLGIALARQISWLLKLFKSHVAIAILAFGLSLVIAGMFEAFGLTLIIGAYVMGLALSRTDIKHVIQENLQSIYTFFVPIFFCVMGMMVDLNALCSKPVLIFGLIYTALAVFAKLVGCAIPSLFCGFNFLGSLRVGAGMVPRGEVALIVAGIGLANGFLTQEVFGIGILMTLITTVVAPPMLVGLFVPQRRGVRNPRESHDGSRQIVFTLPTPQVASVMAVKLVEEFRKEDFFTIQLSKENNLEIWEISMDSAEMSLTRTNAEIRLECTPAEEAIVQQAWIEVISEMNQLCRVAADPLQKGKMGNLVKAVVDSADVKGGSSDVVRCIRRFVMLPEVTVQSFEELVDSLLAKMDEAGLIKDMAQARGAILKREQDMSTALTDGIALPHGRTDAVEGLVGIVAIVKNENGIPGYDTIDHSPVRVVVLTIASESGRTPHLQVMACLSRLLSKNSAGLLACTTPLAMREFLLKGAR